MTYLLRLLWNSSTNPAALTIESLSILPILSINSITGARQISSRYCRFALCSVCGRAFHALLQGCGDKRVQIAIQHRLGVAGLDAGTQILDA